MLPACCGPNGWTTKAAGRLVGGDAKDVAIEDALSYVAGYAAANDITARWWRRSGGSLSAARALIHSVRWPWRREEVPDPQPCGS